MQIRMADCATDQDAEAFFIELVQGKRAAYAREGQRMRGVV